MKGGEKMFNPETMAVLELGVSNNCYDCDDGQGGECDSCDASDGGH